MPQEKPNVPKQLRLGRTRNSIERKPPEASGGSGSIRTNFQEINWTPSKLTITIILLCIPYIVAIIVSLAVKNYLIAGVFVGIGFLVVGMYFLLRYLERSDF
ncbi:hypothetical protein I4641_14565 [Waterburya agarophytonicola K14]|uniref:Uncharacterized protein n=1 Tax=Waterburya agarophytonicola KI4 TaxID=2874699 RepID=A0A964BU32_9CYAN|nr:hypothetical protein [Waterburya agarophytonicola]MCC0178202.1 hypothetical protein [Waterburya agarophytonicola KI4]